MPMPCPCHARVPLPCSLGLLRLTPGSPRARNGFMDLENGWINRNMDGWMDGWWVDIINNTTQDLFHLPVMCLCWCCLSFNVHMSWLVYNTRQALLSNVNVIENNKQRCCQQVGFLIYLISTLGKTLLPRGFRFSSLDVVSCTAQHTCKSPTYYCNKQTKNTHLLYEIVRHIHTQMEV